MTINKQKMEQLIQAEINQPTNAEEMLYRLNIILAENIPALLDKCAKINCTTVKLMKSDTRKNDPVKARQQAIYLLKKHTKMSLHSIGDIFGKDHATVIHSIKTVENFIETEQNYRLIMDDLDDFALTLCGKPEIVLTGLDIWDGKTKDELISEVIRLTVRNENIAKELKTERKNSRKALMEQECKLRAISVHSMSQQIKELTEKIYSLQQDVEAEKKMVRLYKRKYEISLMPDSYANR